MATVNVSVTLDQIDLRNATSANPVKGRHVDNLQGLLKAADHSVPGKGFDPGPIDGLGGDKTKAAVGNFQAAYAPPKDFIVGAKTWKALIEFLP